MNEDQSSAFEGKLRRSGTLLERLSDLIESQIRSGELAVGEQLPPEGSLATTYGVSRPLVREALANLRARGYLRTVNGRGTFVRHPDEVLLADALEHQTELMSARPLTPDDLYEARGAIEVVAARLAAERGEDATYTELAALLQQMRDHASDPVAYTAADVGFHVALARASENPLLPALLAPLMKMIVDGVYESHSTPDGTDAGIRAHTRILGCVAKRDGAGAARAMRKHLAESRQFFPAAVTAGAGHTDR